MLSMGRAMKFSDSPPRWVFYVIFTISGFTGLIYESIWSHYLKLFLGHAAYAQSLVLTIFMGGLGLGSWIAARFSGRLRAPILLYAIVEGGIGAFALFFHDIFVVITDAFYFSILPDLASPSLAGALKWIAASTLIAPQSALLGMTFPLLTGGIIRRYPDQAGGSLAMLYFTNSIGAAIGVLISGFWLIGVVGLPGTIMTAGLLNIALALTVWLLVILDPQPAASPLQTTASSARTDPLTSLFFAAAAVTGAASFVYEIGWLRMLSLVLGSTTHSFELMLSAFITGLAFGGLWIKRRIDRIEDSMGFAGWVQVLMGAMAALSIPLYVKTFDWMAALLSALQPTDSGYNLYAAFSHGIALFVMVPTTFLAGMTLPLFTHALLRRGQGEAAIGRVYAINTLGSIAGVLFAVHIGMPMLGLKSLILFGAALDIVLGLTLLSKSGAGPRLIPVAQGALLGAVVLMIVSLTVQLDPRRLASGVYRYKSAELGPEKQLLSHEHGKTSSVSLFATGTQLTIATNGKPDAAIQMDSKGKRALDEITMVMAAALPLAYNPHARRAANIGFGSGLTTHTLLANPGLERVDTVEIEAAMVRVARAFGKRVSRAYHDPRSSIYIEDAKTFFSLQSQDYDIIIAEPSNPWVSGVASLFSQEFYRTLPNYLTPEGIFIQWLQLYEFNDHLLLSALKALSLNFADFAIYNTDNANILIVAKVRGRLPRPDFSRLWDGALGGELADVGLRGADDVLVRQVGTRQEIGALLDLTLDPPNSDFFPFLDLNAAKARFKVENALLFYGWSVSTLPLLEMLGLGSFDHRRVTDDDNFNRAHLIQKARDIHDQVVLKREGAGNGDTTLALVLSFRSTCGQTAIEEEALLEALHILAQKTLPFLDRQAAIALIDALMPAECLAPGFARLGLWVNLYRALAARDACDIAPAAIVALADAASDAHRRRYALAAAMLGHLVCAQPQAALDLWAERPRQLRELGPAPDIDLIVMLAGKRVAEMQADASEE
jgi:spermidine synthase